MSGYHNLNNTDKVKTTCNTKSVERVKDYKPLAMIIDKKISNWDLVTKFWIMDIL